MCLAAVELDLQRPQIALCLHNVNSAVPFQCNSGSVPCAYNNPGANSNFAAQNKAWIEAAVKILEDNNNAVPDANLCPAGNMRDLVDRAVAMG